MITKESFFNAVETIKEYIAQIEDENTRTKTPISKWVEDNRSIMQHGCGQATTRLFNTMQHIDIHDPNKIVPRYIEDIKQTHMFTLKGFGHKQWDLFLESVKTN